MPFVHTGNLAFLCKGGKRRPQGLAEQTGQQGDEGDADQSDTAASHQLFHALRLAAG